MRRTWRRWKGWRLRFNQLRAEVAELQCQTEAEPQGHDVQLQRANAGCTVSFNFFIFQPDQSVN